ncbi:asparaginase domain-containing protein [Acinetobacter ihumii]|uniref:asparaginase domain-containing protein n=1 Tax=Acinetobacter ihumii TaxID=2483802 RepID=UPI0010319DBD|nr:asparaginase domain-containing protein [Acinetobacter ihumii]
MNKIALLYMGGTFGCIGEPLAPMPFTEFLPMLQRLIADDFDVDCFAAPVIKDSSACTASDWLTLVQQIQSLQQQGYSHFVVIHGTDTLSYAAATLARFLGQSCRVVVTGSQYPLLNVAGREIRDFTDARDNLYLALQQVRTLSKGVYLAFHQQVFHAQTALKIHTTELNAFTGTLAAQHCNTVIDAQVISEADLISCRSLSILNVMAQPIELESFKQQLNNLLIHPPHFLVIQGFGTGNLAVDSNIIKIFHQLRLQGCLSILDTQVCFGQMDQRYAISEWVHQAQILMNNTHGHADLYAKLLQLYLKYSTLEQREQHWSFA